MKLEALSLERYGTFTGRELRFAPGAQVHVVHGANEAGKTSALAAITDFLFGFGHTTPYGFQHDQNLLRIGATLRLADGSSLSLRRRKGRGLTVLDADDRTLEEDPLAARLGVIDRQTFCEEYGLTAGALRQGGAELMKAGGRLAECLAASSAGLSRLVRLRNELEANADALFRPTRVATKDFYVATDRHKSAELKLRDAVVTVDAWKAANRAIAETSEAHAALQAEAETLRADLARRERARRTRPKLAALAQARNALAGYADLPAATPEALAQWRRALDDEARLREQAAELDEAEVADRVRIETLAIDEPLLSAGGTLDALQQRIGEIAKARSDLPRRIGAQRSAYEALSAAARRVGLGSAEALLAQQPTDAALARVRELLLQGRRLEERMRDAQAALAVARADRERLATEGRTARPMADPAVLRRRLDVFAEIPVDVDRLRRERAAVQRAASKLVEEAATLQPSIGDLETMAATPLPTVAMIAQARMQADAVMAQLRDNGADTAAAAEQVRTAERAIAKLAAQGLVTTWADLDAARSARAAAWAALDEGLDAPDSERRQAFEATGAAILRADAVADRLLADTVRAATMSAARERLREAQERMHDCADTRRDMLLAQQRGEEAWKAGWSRTGIAPLEPGQMQAWRERLAELIERRDSLSERRSEIAALAEKLEGCRAGLKVLGAELGVVVAAGASLDLAYREIAAALDALQSAWTQAREHDVAVSAAGRAVASANSTLERLHGDHQTWRSIWPEAIETIGLPANAGLAEAEAAITVWQGVPAEKVAYLRESQSVVGIERDLRRFAEEVGGLAQRVAADLAERSPQEALASMARRLVDARDADRDRLNLARSADARRPKRAAVLAKLDQTAATLDAARRRLDLDADAMLAPVLERLAARHEHEATGARLLADLAAEGLDEAALIAEQTDIDLPQLDSSIEALDRRLAELTRNEIGAARAAMEQARAALQALAIGRDAEGAACDKEAAVVEIRDIAERWMARAAAAKLATLAIERHRASVQDPLVARASQLFTLVTGTAFDGLTTQYQDDQETPILVGRRADGRTVRVDGMSEGTRDQLYLVLRLSLLERNKLAPLPFIGDDLLASFDETRTAHALDVLAAFGEDRQVILFTHHAHVAEIARQRLGQRADLIAL